ncbi:hypothetical protein [Reichenbachiella sp.]|uniref:hypothetical protein n=1 Tax=Reichenbachiella sp. TaxID=2184521 RepID=UPI00329A1D82
MKPEIWHQPGTFYILKINQNTKLGITRNFQHRLKLYASQYKRSRFPLQLTIHYKEEYQEFWHLEFIETMVRRKLYPWVSPNSLEYIRPEIPTKKVIECYFEIKQYLNESNKYNWIKEYHTVGKLRFKLYKLFFLEHKEFFDSIDMTSTN